MLGQPDHSEKLGASERVNQMPMSHLSHFFTKFLDIMHGRYDVPGHSDIGVAVLHKAVDELAKQMTRYFDSQDVRREAGLPCLNRIFSAYKGIKIPTLAAASIGYVRTKP